VCCRNRVLLFSCWSGLFRISSLSQFLAIHNWYCCVTLSVCDVCWSVLIQWWQIVQMMEAKLLCDATTCMYNLCLLGSWVNPLVVSVVWFVDLFAGEKKSKFDVKFDDRSVCKSFLLGCCPHDILSATVCLVLESFLSIPLISWSCTNSVY